MSIHTELTPEDKERLRKQKVTSTVTSLIVSVLTLAVIGLLLGLLMIVIPVKEIETIVSYNAPQEEEVEDSNRPKVNTNQNNVPTPSQSASAAVNIISAATAGDIAGGSS